MKELPKQLERCHKYKVDVSDVVEQFNQMVDGFYIKEQIHKIMEKKIIVTRCETGQKLKINTTDTVTDDEIKRVGKVAEQFLEGDADFEHYITWTAERRVKQKQLSEEFPNKAIDQKQRLLLESSKWRLNVEDYVNRYNQDVSEKLQNQACCTVQ